MNEDLIGRLIKSIKKDMDRITDNEEENALNIDLKSIVLKCKEKIDALEYVLLNHCPILQKHLNKNNKNEEE
jgi:hypothetical protein